MIHPGLISREPNIESTLKRMRNEVEKDYKMPGSLWLLPIATAAVLITSFFVKEPLMNEWSFRLIILFIGVFYFLVILPLMSKENLTSDERVDTIKANTDKMKVYYQKALDDKWRYVSLIFLTLFYGAVLGIFVYPGIEHFQSGIADAVIVGFQGLTNISLLLIIVIGSYYTRKRHKSALLEIEKKYQEIGINI